MKGVPTLRPGQEVAEWASNLVGFLEQNQSSPNVGQVGEFAVLPEGWLPADGSTFSKAGHPNLYRVLGGNTLPNLSPVYDAGNVVGIKA